MNCKYKYLIVIFCSLYSISSYSQRLLIENGNFYIDTYGMNKEILAVTVTQQAMRKDASDGSTLMTVTGMGSFVNRLISAKFEIYPSDLSAGLWTETREKCATLEPAGAWRVPTLNEALLMLTFYDQMKPLQQGGLGSEVPGFTIPDNAKSYATATLSSRSGFFYFFRWGRSQLSAGYYGYYGESNTNNNNISLRCIRDVPQ